MIVYGVRPVVEALRARRVLSLRVARRRDPAMAALLAEAASAGIVGSDVGAEALDRETGGAAHQGVVATVAVASDVTLEAMVSRRTPALVVVLDGIEDPQNFGAILRVADAAGVNGVVRQTRHAAPLSSATAKASAGAIAHVPIASVVNVARALEELKALGLWVVGLAGDGDRSHTEIDWSMPSVLVLGSEGSGLRRLVRERCDWLARIPMHGAVDSLNVSTAAAVALFEAERQRAGGQGVGGGRGGGHRR